jgi:bacteriocin biosynthesis cyclodehydratase domain-containing protein
VGSALDDRAPDLVVLAGSRPPDDGLRRRLHDDAIPHLAVGVDAIRAVIGPLVVPGRTSCLRCADLHRRDRDPAWPALAAQLSTSPHRFEPSDVALCTAASGLAAVQALAFLDGDAPATIDGSLEMTLPDWRLRRRSRPSHPDCDCRRDPS